MTANNAYRFTAVLLFVLPFLLISWKCTQGYFQPQQFQPKTTYQVAFNCTIDSVEAGKDWFVKVYLPETNLHQQISKEMIQSDDLHFQQTHRTNIGKRGIWRGRAQKQQALSYAFHYEGHALRYQLAAQLPIPSRFPDTLEKYLAPEEHIQSDHPLILDIATQLTAGEKNLTARVRNLYNFVLGVPSIHTSDLTGALTALRKNSASCNGKSRLLVALCRASGIPARVVGGVILETTQKKTSHLWMEMWIVDRWIPFDALNDHFAFLPAHYMQLYTGDHFLIARSPRVAFDYHFDIQQQQHLPIAAQQRFTLWPILAATSIPTNLLKVLLLLPLCALVVGLFRNIIGFKTIGVFLPAIIAVSIEGIGFWFGLSAFVLVVAIVSLLHFPMERWGILHTPKLIIMLTGVVVCLLCLAQIGVFTGSTMLGSILFFPIIVLTIAAEKFAKTIVTEGYLEALKLQGQTLVLTMLCYLVYQADFTVAYFLTFPESYAIIIGLLLLLGRWIGLRLTEYQRFAALATPSSVV
ncbi:MAG: 7TM domain-containing protein [Bacteroidota bacterium]